jgi:N-acetylneuraminate synthase
MTDTPPRTIVIAEAGVNHNGRTDLALDLVDAAAKAGADAVKFQTFVADQVARPDAVKAEYQKQAGRSGETQLQMLQDLELSAEAHRAVAARCREKGIEFISTPFDEESLSFLCEEIGVTRLKIASGEITNGPLLLRAARTGLPVLLSTGASTLDDIRRALGVLTFGMIVEDNAQPCRAAFEAAFDSPEGRARLAERVTLLQCTSAYPAPLEDVNLRAIDGLRAAFGLPVGISDHSVGIAVPVAATALGSTVVEKHFTLDRSMPGPDHRASIEADDLTRMIAAIRDVEQALGRRDKTLGPSENANQAVIRRSLVAIRPIRRGESLGEHNVGARRPAGGLSPMAFWELCGTEAHRDYQPGELIVG